MQSLPPIVGEGLVQNRFLVMIPWPHVTEHGVHKVHSLKFPLTMKNSQKHTENQFTAPELRGWGANKSISDKTAKIGACDFYVASRTSRTSKVAYLTELFTFKGFPSIPTLLLDFQVTLDATYVDRNPNCRLQSLCQVLGCHNPSHQTGQAGLCTSETWPEYHPHRNDHTRSTDSSFRTCHSLF